jgi:transposase
MTNEKLGRKKYSEEFKKDAVALVTTQGYRVTDAARSLGVCSTLIHKWKNELSTEKSLDENEREELKRLRREVATLKMEKEILKKASAYFAKYVK